MQKLVKDFNYVYDYADQLYVLYYLDDDFTIKEYKTYNVIGNKITDVFNVSVDIRILADITDLTMLGFRYNPYLTRE